MEVLKKLAGTTETMTFEASFRGYLSGDYESFCFAVPPEDCLSGIPLEWRTFDANWFHPGLMSFYPHRLFSDSLEQGKMYRFRIVIEAEPIKDESEKQAGNPPTETGATETAQGA